MNEYEIEEKFRMFLANIKNRIVEKGMQTEHDDYSIKLYLDEYNQQEISHNITTNNMIESRDPKYYD